MKTSFFLGFLVATLLFTGIFFRIILKRIKCDSPDAICLLVQNQSRFESCVKLINNDLLLPNHHGIYLEPPDLRNFPIRNIRKDHDLIFFDYVSNWPDDCRQVLIYDLQHRPAKELIPSLLKLYPRRGTYHIELVFQAKGPWYYWEYD